ncbi:hypothetical protein AC065_00650 [Escherichia coli]|nr:hypothetical protein AC065_00650 [Escherichia coli]
MNFVVILSVLDVIKIIEGIFILIPSILYMQELRNNTKKTTLLYYMVRMFYFTTIKTLVTEQESNARR